jgi:hypothetical protein
MTNNHDAAEDYVRLAHTTLLGRDPDAVGLRYYLRMVRRGQGLEAVLDSIVSSPEYRHRYPATPNLLFNKAKQLFARLFRPGTSGTTLYALNQVGAIERLRSDMHLYRGIAKDHNALSLRLANIEELLEKRIREADDYDALSLRLTRLEELLAKRAE